MALNQCSDDPLQQCIIGEGAKELEVAVTWLGQSRPVPYGSPGTACGAKPPNCEGGVCPLRPDTSDVDLFCNCECIVDLDPEVSDGAFYLGMPQ
jgi:hypothetical protein